MKTYSLRFLAPYIRPFPELLFLMETEFEAGVFLVDKPEGSSSFYMVRKVRKALGMKKVGHAGTLDPFATGLLNLLVSWAVKNSYFFIIPFVPESVLGR